MNKERLQAIHKRLIEIKNRIDFDKDKVISGNLRCRTESGVCKNLTNFNGKKLKSTSINATTWLINQFEAWPECYTYGDGSKCTEYPVGGLNEQSKEAIDGTLWENPKRLELLDFLIKQAEIQLKEMN